MRIRRRDRGEPTRALAEELSETPAHPVEDLIVTVPAAVRSVDLEPDLVPVPDSTPPPFDQALLSPAPSPAPDVAPTPTAAPSTASVDGLTQREPVSPTPIAVREEVVAEPVPPAPAPILQQPSPTPATDTVSKDAATPPVVTPPAVTPSVVTPEPAPPPSPAAVPATGPSPSPPPAAVEAAGTPQMRTPTIRNEADALLDGTRPAPRELPRVIAIANQKGGVGKTTTTVNLGAALAEIGYRVLVIDLDPQGNATTGLGIDARNFELSMYDVIMRDQSLEDCIEPTSVKNLFVAPATIDLAGIEIELVPAFSREMKLKRAIDTVVDDFDFILIDCPPSLGLITVNGLAAAGEVMVPIQCEYYALEGLSQLLRNVNLVSSNLNESLEVTTIVLTMFDARTRLSVDVANEVRLHFADRVCKSVIPRTVRLSEAPSFGQPITVFDPTSRGAVAYRELAKEVSNGAPQRTR